MKLRNKKTGKIANFASVNRDYDGANNIGLVEIGIERGKTIPLYSYNSLAELNEEWEDYEEPKGIYFINAQGEVNFWNNSSFARRDWTKEKQIGNYFETKEEAEKAVEKLKAWKRLKDKGFRFEGIKQDYTRFSQQVPMRYGRKYLQFNKSEDEEWMKDNWEELDLLFGGEQ